MSISVCAITGQALQNPVASLKTGHLFEKEIIEKHLNSFPYCPITNQAMSSSDIVEIVAYNGSFSRQDQSPSTFLNKIQNEYDTLVIEVFKLRQCLKQTQQEITSALYQNEAASRVIAKSLKEKQQLESEIEKLQTRIVELKGKV